MKSLKGSRTEKNIMVAFAGESEARNKYTYWGGVARKEGYVQIANIFEETASQEKEHAKRLFKFLEGGTVEITASFPAGLIGDTYANLMAAAGGEREEYTHMYPGFAKIAYEEGYDGVAKVMEAIAVAEKWHEKRYLDFAANIKAGSVFDRQTPVFWRCLNCGYIHEGPGAPEACPACAHPKAHFELRGQNW
ncbi:MAG: rubrerythrin family protein [Deltaproteobacteria bacterium]|jgi:rubrerythrin|nr:rubrerythrin family protein [Deltaproteobacteria bacterium]